MKPLKIIYYTLFTFLILIVGLLVVSIFPITGNIKFMVVQSGSMEPAIKMGNVIMIKPVAKYEIGDVITFSAMGREEESTTHRIYDIQEGEEGLVYITKGDANNAPDTREVLPKEVMGKVLLNILYLGYAVNFTRQPLGFVLLILCPGAVIIGDEVKKIYYEIKKEKKEKQKNNQKENR